MKKLDKKKIIIIIIVVLIILVIVGAVLFYRKTNGATKCNNKDTYFDLYYDEDKTMNSKEFSKNDIFSEFTYKEIHLNANNPKLQEVIYKLNKESKERYDEITSDKNLVSASNCPEIANDFKYRVHKNSIITLNENKDYYSINVVKTSIDLCKDEENTVDGMDNYLFDKNADDFISQEDFMKKENLTDEKIVARIKEKLAEWAKIDNIDYVYSPEYNGRKNYILYYNETNILSAMYYSPELEGYIEVYL